MQSTGAAQPPAAGTSPAGSPVASASIRCHPHNLAFWHNAHGDRKAAQTFGCNRKCDWRRGEVLGSGVRTGQMGGGDAFPPPPSLRWSTVTRIPPVRSAPRWGKKYEAYRRASL